MESVGIVLAHHASLLLICAGFRQVYGSIQNHDMACCGGMAYSRLYSHCTLAFRLEDGGRSSYIRRQAPAGFVLQIQEKQGL